MKSDQWPFMLLVLLLLRDLRQHGALFWLLPLLVPLPEVRVVLLHQAIKHLLPTLKHSQHRWHMTALRVAAAPQPLAAADTTASAVDNKIRLLLLLLLQQQHYGTISNTHTQHPTTQRQQHAGANL
jgi:hypothetical protein